jgi:6-phosphogluconolactonase
LGPDVRQARMLHQRRINAAAMTFGAEVFPAERWADDAAARVTGALPRGGVVIVTGGGAARVLYPRLAAHADDWSGIDVFFSDERCVPPEHADSNYKMVRETLLDRVTPRAVHRMRGEDDPRRAAAAYDEEIRAAVERGPEVLLLGMGADGHIAALFPNSPALDITDRLCAAVDRPDGMQGLTLTPPALLSARRVFLVVTGSAKAEAVARALKGRERYSSVPVRLLADHPNTMFLLDEPAAA